MLDFEVKRCTRCCATTERPFVPGDSYYSVLEAEGAEVVRRDYGEEAWQGPSDGIIGWWRSKMPEAGAGKPKLAPSEVALELFDRWREAEEKEDAAYVLALFLLRKRIFRFAESAFTSAPAERDILQIHCPKRASEYEVPVAVLSDERAAEIQEQLIELLYADAD
ncbi:MAG: hypothetical protein ACR2NU_13430 [Aeoliella sp.]